MPELSQDEIIQEGDRELTMKNQKSKKNNAPGNRGDDQRMLLRALWDLLRFYNVQQSPTTPAKPYLVTGSRP